MRTAVLLLLLVFSGNILANNNGDPDVEKTNWHLCLLKKINDIDDGVSTASDIGSAVDDACEDEYDALTNKFNFPLEMKAEISKNRRISTKEMATKLVLLQRAEKAKRQKNKK